MNIRLPRLTALALCFLVPTIGRAEPPPDAPGSLTLSDAVVLPGSPEGSDANGDLLWRINDLIDPVAVPFRSLVEMRLAGTKPSRQAGPHEAQVTLTNGDLLHGVLAGVSATRRK